MMGIGKPRFGLPGSKKALRVSFYEVSVERLESMLSLLDQKRQELLAEVAGVETSVRALYDSTEDVRLEFDDHFFFELDRKKDELTALRDQLDDLALKRKLVDDAYQERVLIEAQVRVLGTRQRVRIKDGIVSLLIFLVLAILGIEAGRVGAGGEGAKLKPVIVDGEFESVVVVEGGKGYEDAEAVPIHGLGGGGEAEFELTVESGRVVAVVVQPTSKGTGYEDTTKLLVRPLHSSRALYWFWLVDSLCCLVFLWNFRFERRCAASSRWYWRTHWIDFLTSIPLPPAQLLAQCNVSGTAAVRAGRALRLMRLFRALRALRLLLFLWRGLDRLAEVFDVRLMKKSLISAVIVMLAGAVLITVVGERGEDYHAVQGFFPGLWWSFTTLVTGGFGDIYNPETTGGRLLTVFLVIAGMVLIGVFTATLTTLLVGKENQKPVSAQSQMLDLLKTMNENSEGSGRQDGQRDVEERLADLEARVEALAPEEPPAESE